MKVIIDNGHGMNTPGKRSPKGMLTEPDMVALYEFEFNRDIVCRLKPLLERSGIDYEILVPEIEDISLVERCKRANKIYKDAFNSAFLISIHANAGGGTGWEVFTSVGDTLADPIAQVFAEKAKEAFPEFKMRFDLADGDFDKEVHFYILKNTSCPSVLTENFFMDTEKDLEFITSDQGRQRIAQMHHDAIVEYINNGIV
jgi:N-acetylmuramoyl-L-alanine amidase